MSELYRDDYYNVRVEHGILRLERTATAYPTMQAMHHGNVGLAGALRAAGVKRVLLDLRKGPPGRNDEDFESQSSKWRMQLAKECERVAVLVRTVAGKLQAQRLSRSEQRGGNANVFMDEAEALAYLNAR
jgi:hypothetical protein